MPIDERKQEIMNVLAERRDMSLRELGNTLHYSQATLRRDVSALAAEGLLYRTHGKIHWNDSVSNIVLPARDRGLLNLNSKHLIALKAAELVQEGSSIILDSGTTTCELARVLTSRSVNIVTNSLEISLIMAQSASQIISCGGLLQAKHLCFLGPDAEKFFSNIEADMLFIGTTGVRGSYGLTTSSPLQYNIKQAMIAAAKKRIALFDLSKLNAACLFVFSDFSNIDTIITQKPQPGSREEETLRQIEKKNVEILFA